MFRTRKKALTLIEMLLVVSMLSIVMLAIYSTFNSGLRIWERLIQRKPVESLSIFFEKISGDLRNGFSFEEIPFSGLSREVNFASLVLSPVGDREEDYAIGRITYFFNPAKGTLNRQTADYSQLYQSERSKTRELMDDVVSFKLYYYYYDSRRDVYLWKEMWFEEDEEAKLPLAVRVNVSYMEDGLRKVATRTLDIPSATQFHYE